MTARLVRALKNAFASSEERAAPDTSLVRRMSGAYRVGSIAGDVAHDLNNHLQVVLGNAELLGTADTLSEAGRRQHARIVEAARHAAEANAALLALAREAESDGGGAEAGGGATREERLTLGELIDARAVHLARLADPVALDVRVAADVRTWPVSGVPGRTTVAELVSLLALQARTVHAPGARVTLHVRPEENAAPAPEDVATTAPVVSLRLGIEPDGSVGADAADGGGGDRGAGSVAGAERGAPTLPVEILTALAESAGGRLVVSGSGGGPGDVTVSLPLEPSPPGG